MTSQRTFTTRILTSSALFIAARTTSLLVLLIAACPGQAQTETVLWNFTVGRDGYQPLSSLTSHGGNFYGTTTFGGAECEGQDQSGCGTVFELSPNGSGGWNETVLYSFCSAPNCADGSIPEFSFVIFDSAGNLYGTTAGGGAHGFGVVFELSPVGGIWTETVLHSFAGNPDGWGPQGSLIRDAAGNLYGTTHYGGSGFGTVFELSPSVGGWTEQVIYDVDSSFPGGLAIDSAGNIFGIGHSTAFELSPNGSGGWTPTVIHTFTGGPLDGNLPEGALVLDKAGDLYGTTTAGGANGFGTVYKLSPGDTGWTENILYSFKDTGQDGFRPTGGIVFDAGGNIYGTTSRGGATGAGTVFELAAPVDGGSYSERILWSFNVTGGASPCCGLVLDSAGNYYGTTYSGGSSNGGVVFEVSHAITTTTTIVSSLNPSTHGQAVTFTAAVTSINGAPPNGESVTFFNGSDVLGTVPLRGGVASLRTSALLVGVSTITARYVGDANFLTSTSPGLEQSVNSTSKLATSTALSSNLSPSTYGQAVTFAATVTATGGIPPNGETVTFYWVQPENETNGLYVLGTSTITGGIASLTTSSLQSGIFSISAAYLGDANFSGSTSSSLQQGVDTSSQSATTTALTSNLNPSIYGQKVTWTATVKSSRSTTPTGKVNFNWGDFYVGTAALSSNGVATLTRSLLSADAYPLFAVYTGDTNNGPSASPILHQVITQTTSAATITASPNPSTQGQSVTFTAKITSPTTTPAGPVTFTAGKTMLGSVELSEGKATFTTSTLAIGSTTVTVTYPWDSDTSGSSAAVTQVVHQ
jgi:uncharacterized repeat protein (TIGR03803 family)